MTEWRTLAKEQKLQIQTRKNTNLYGLKKRI